MNKSTNMPPGPSLKGGKNRTRRGGGFFNCVGSRCSRKATVAPEPTTPRTSAYNDAMNELKELGDLIMDKTLELTELNSNSPNFNSRRGDIELLQQRYDKLNDNIYAKFIKPKLTTIKQTSNILERPFKGGKRKSGRTRRSRK